MALTINFIQEQLKNVTLQRDNALATFQQCVGAITLLTEQLATLELETESNKKIDTKDKQGDDYVCTESSDSQQVA